MKKESSKICKIKIIAYSTLADYLTLCKIHQKFIISSNNFQNIINVNA